MDRFFRGFLAGITGGIVMSIWDLLLYHAASFSSHRYLDWGAVLLLGERAATFIEAAYAQLVHLIWAGFMGIIFAYLVRTIGSKGLLLKGALTGFIAAVIYYILTKLFDVPHLFAMPIESVITNHIGAVIWGLTTAYVLGFLDRRYKET